MQIYLADVIKHGYRTENFKIINVSVIINLARDNLGDFHKYRGSTKVTKISLKIVIGLIAAAFCSCIIPLFDQ